MARFANGKAPFIRIADQEKQGTNFIMRDFLIGLLPIILFSWIKNGLLVYIDGNIGFLEMLYPLVFILLGGLSSLLMEGLFFYITDKEARNLKEMKIRLGASFALIPGLILAMLLPLYTPIWVLLFGCFMGTIVGKMLFGGFGHNIFNPALLGYLAVGFTLTSVITTAGGALNASELMVDTYAGVTPLGTLAATKKISYEALVAPYGNLWNFFLGTIPGALGETGALALLIAYIWYVVRGVIKWFTPLVYVGTVFVCSWFIGMIVGETGLWFPTYSILSGGVIFAAVLMITEPVTTPKNPMGKVVFALFLGVLTVLFRFVGNFPEGVGTSLIIMNIFTMPIDNSTAIIRSSTFKKEPLIRGLVLLVILILIFVYTIIKAGNMYSLFISFSSMISGVM